MAKKGGARQGAGRPKGSTNKMTAELKALAQQHTAKALEVIVELAVNGEAETTRLAAAKEILDRGYGRTPQAVAAEITTNTVDPRPAVDNAAVWADIGRKFGIASKVTNLQ